MRRRRRSGAARPAVGAAAGAEIVRYHPHLRCTVRLGERFGKVRPTKRTGAAGRAARLWVHRDELGFAVAEPLGYDEATRTVWLGAVAGEPEAEPTPALAERMGAALATLAVGVVPPTVRRGAAGAGDGGAACRARGARAMPRARRGRARAAPRGRRAARRSPRSTRRRPTRRCGRPRRAAPAAWLIDGDALGLIDFDRLAPRASQRPTSPPSRRRGRDARAVADAFARGYGALDATPARGVPPRAQVAKALRAAYDPAPGRRRAGGAAAREEPPRPLNHYGCVVHNVNVSVLLYVPVRSASLALIRWLKPSVTASLEIGPLYVSRFSGEAEEPTLLYAVPVLAALRARACSGCGRENVPLTRWPGGAASSGRPRSGARRRRSRSRSPWSRPRTSGRRPA